MDSKAKNDTIHYICIPRSTGTTSIVVTMLAFPFHMLMIKILAKDVQLSLPRHQIMFCLSISDALQIFTISSLSIVMIAFDLTTESTICLILRDITIFTATLTVVVASLTLVTLAIERMTVCMYFLKHQALFPKMKTTKVLANYWVIGKIMGLIAMMTNDKRKAETIVSETMSFQIISIVFILPSAVIIAVIQVRLFLFSRARVTQVIPARAVVNQQNTPNFRQRQIRIAFVAGIVSIAYIVCMVPLAMVFFFERLSITHSIPSVKTPLVSLALINTLSDPFIYGFGLTQTRQILIRIIRNILPTCITRS